MKTPYIIAALILIFTFTSCRRDPLKINTKGIRAEVKIKRFDRELFNHPDGDLTNGIDTLYRKYGDFFEVFGYNIISVGSPSEKNFEGFLRIFLNDDLNREVFNTVQKVFPDLEKEEEELSSAFKRYLYHFPGKTIPEVVAFVSRFNNSCFTVGNYLGIGLDMYLGKDHPYYKQLGIPDYQKNAMSREKIASDAMYALGVGQFPFNDSVSNVLAHLIHLGKIMYFTEAMLPNKSDEMIMGITKDQNHWFVHNEKMMWVFLVENKMLFSEDEMMIRRLTGPAPFTYYFSNVSPGRAGMWIGWQITRQYMERNPGVTLNELMEEKDYEKILRLSKYNP